MRRLTNSLRIALVAGAAAALAASAAGQCTTYDFDQYAPGTVFTSAPGVSFSAVPGSCGGPGSIVPIIVSPAGGTSSGSNALGIQTGCPDFSPDFLRLDFDNPQRFVSFTVGEQVTPGMAFTVRSYRENGSLIGGSGVTAGSGCYRLVELGSPDGVAQIARVEIECNIGLFECIDDLAFDADLTPPVVRIDSPTHGDCFCEPTISISGIVCDDDGLYGEDVLEMRPVNAAPGTPWELIRRYVGSPICDPGVLYVWNIVDVPHGWYYLRVTATNGCGATANDVISVLVDKTFGTVEVDSPSHQAEVCGAVEITGTIDDHCGSCFVQYTVDYAQFGEPGSYAPVDPANPTYTEPVRNGTLALWDTNALAIPAGLYQIRCEGIDECGNTKEIVTAVLLTPCSDCPEDIDESGDVGFADLLRVLGQWGPCP